MAELVPVLARCNIWVGDAVPIPMLAVVVALPVVVKVVNAPVLGVVEPIAPGDAQLGETVAVARVVPSGNLMPPLVDSITPATDSFWPGDVVPIPTLPPLGCITTG